MKNVEKLCFALLLLAFAGVVYVGLPLIEALAFGVALAYIVRPVAYKIRPVLGPSFSSFFSLAVAIFLLSAFFFYSLGSLLIEANTFIETKQYEQLTQPVDTFLKENPTARGYFEMGTQLTLVYFSNQLKDLGQIIGNVMGVINFVITVFMSLIISFYLLKDGPKLKAALLDIVPSRYSNLIEKAYERIDKDLQTMFVGSLFTAVFVWILVSLILIYFGVPYAMLIGALSGLLQLIPMVGPQLVLIPVGLWLAFNGNLFVGFAVLALAIGLFLFSDLIVRTALSKKTGTVHPLIVLIAFIGGVLAFGLKGVVLGPVIFALLDGLMKAHKELGS